MGLTGTGRGLPQRGKPARAAGKREAFGPPRRTPPGRHRRRAVIVAIRLDLLPMERTPIGTLLPGAFVAAALAHLVGRGGADSS